MWRTRFLRRLRGLRQSGLGRVLPLRRPLGIRGQLTLLYTAIFAVLFLVVAGAYYIALDRTLQANFDATLATRAAQIASGVSRENGVVTIQDVTGELPGNVSAGAPSGAGDAPTSTEPPNVPASQSGEQSNVSFGTLVRILDARGSAVYISPGFKALTLPARSVTDPLRGTLWLGTITAPDGTVVRVESIPLRDNGEVYGVLQVGAPATSLHETLGAAALALFGVAPLLLLLGAGGSYWLARRALGPIERLAASAQEIEANDLQRRVPVPEARDEVQVLALTLNGMIARLERAFDQQRRFVADASHELRTPVAAIQSLTDVALAQPGNAEETTETLRAVNSEAQRLGTLISDLLALARADEGQVRLEHEPVRLDLLAGDVAGVVEPLATEQGVTLDLRLAPVTVLGDDARLIQMTLNLVDNAVHYTPVGGHVTIQVGIEVGATSGEPRGEQAFMCVSDTGPGIAPEHLPHIFERFYRADPARTHRANGAKSESVGVGSGQSGGSGLGLAIVEWVARAHGGAVAVQSEVGHGTTVIVRLPLTQPATAAKRAKPTEPRGARTPPPSVGAEAASRAAPASAALPSFTAPRSSDP